MKKEEGARVKGRRQIKEERGRGTRNEVEEGGRERGRRNR